MTKCNGDTPASKKTKQDPCGSKPYNRYNIFYILERERFLQSNSSYKRKNSHHRDSDFLTGYEKIDLPKLPPQYARLDLPYDWYMPGKQNVS